MSKTRFSTTTLATYGLLALAGGGAFVLPGMLPKYASAVPRPTGNMVRLYGKLWDLKVDHPDMEVTPSEGLGVYTGLVSEELDVDGKPVFQGGGQLVLSEALDVTGQPIAPFMANRTGGVINFEIVAGGVTVNEEFAAIVQVLGVDISTIPITFRVSAGGVDYEPFGPFYTPSTGNINDLAGGGNGTGPNPRAYILPSMYTAGTTINVSGQSWRSGGGGSEDIKDPIPLSDVPASTLLAAQNEVPGIVIDEAGNDPSDDPEKFKLRGNVGGTRYEIEIWKWTEVKEVKIIKSSGGTLLAVESKYDSPQVIVLRDGDPVPPHSPAPGQQSLAEYIADYVDETDNTIELETYQVIYLYELYTRDPASPYWDFQDMVVLLSLARPNAIVPPISVAAGCGPQDDTLALLSGASSNGGITDAASFDQWFNDVLGTNLSGNTSIDLYEQLDGTFLFDDQLDTNYNNLGGYYPADGKLLDSGAAGHNDYFTTKFEAMITYDSLANQFLEVTSDGDMWVFIDDQLVIDLGGIHAAVTQRADLSRLCLVDGTAHKLTIYRAQRHTGLSRFRLWTNLAFAPVKVMTVTGQYD